MERIDGPVNIAIEVLKAFDAPCDSGPVRPGQIVRIEMERALTLASLGVARVVDFVPEDEAP